MTNTNTTAALAAHLVILTALPGAPYLALATAPGHTAPTTFLSATEQGALEGLARTLGCPVVDASFGRVLSDLPRR